MRYFLLVCIMAALTPSIALACECLPPSDEMAKKSYEDADIVIKASIMQASKGWSVTGPIARLQVLSIYKGENVPDIITINYNNQPSACGMALEEGNTTTLALYDTRSLVLNSSNTRGFGFRSMISCSQDQVQYYIDNFYDHSQTTLPKIEEE